MKKSILLFFFLSQLIFAQDYGTSLEVKSGWNGWNAIVVQNGLISTATVPDIGARVMQYNLGEYISIYRDSSLNGMTYTPTSNSPFHNLGGFKNWPSPQYGTGRWGWPPPPTLDCGNYSYEILSDTPDSVKIKVVSPIEKWKAPDLQSVRKMTIYKNSSRIKMEQYLINTGTAVVNWGIWDNTQSIGTHPGENDYENFWAYFPKNPNSVFGDTGVKCDKASDAWVGEVAPGIYGCKFTPNAHKLFADPHKGWICYVDELNGVCFAKTFPVFEDAEYPDEGARIAVYMDARYVEVEVTGPVEDIPSGETISFTEDWYSAKVNGPILNVNSVGAVKSFLNLASDTITGNYGVFYVGKAKLIFIDDTDQKIGEGIEHNISPLENFELSESVSLPVGTKKIRLCVFDDSGKLIDVLDELDLNTTLINNIETPIKDFSLGQNYPNPFNPSTVIQYRLPVACNVGLKVYDILGREVVVLVDEQKMPGIYDVIFDGGNIASGMYFYRLKAGDFIQTKKLSLMK